MQRIVPRNPPSVNLAASAALLVGRPGEVRRVLDSLDPPPQARTPVGLRWLTLSGQADHLLGRYDREREAGRAGQAAHPVAAWPREAQVRALAPPVARSNLAAVIRDSQGALTPSGETTPAHLVVRAADAGFEFLRGDPGYEAPVLPEK